MSSPVDPLANSVFEDLLDLASHLTGQPPAAHIRIDPQQLDSTRTPLELSELADRLRRYAAAMEPVHRTLAAAADGAQGATEIPIGRLDASVLLTIVSAAREAATTLARQLKHSHWLGVGSTDASTHRSDDHS